MTIARRRSPAAWAALALVVGTGLPACAQNPPAPRTSPPSFAAARPGDLRVFMSGSLRPAVEKVRPQMEAAVGRPVVLEIRQARLLQQTIQDGAAFDAALLTRPVMETLAAGGHVAPASLVHLGDIPLGVTARGDVSKVDIATPAALRRTLLGAVAIKRNYGVGATAPLIDHMIAELGVGDAIKDKVNPRRDGAPELPPPTLGPGQYELELTLRSEIRPTPGWTYVGTVPEAVKRANHMTAGVAADGASEPGARLIAFLKTPLFRQAMADTGVDPL